MTDLRLPHAPDVLRRLRRPTREDPLRVLVSGCILGQRCAVDGTDFGMGGALGDFITLPNVKILSFCPEDHGLGTPRTMPDIHDGDGFDVLDGRARVLDQFGADLTEKMIAGARAMVEYARANGAEAAILTDMSAACGSQVISDGGRMVEQRRYRSGVGVATASLLRAGIPCVSQRDFKTLGALRSTIDSSFTPDPQAIDHHETPWYRGAFPTGRRD